MSLLHPKDTICSQARDVAGYESGLPYTKLSFFRWSTKVNHPLTNSLLGIIEDSATYKVAPGFDKGDVEAVSSGGKKVIEQYQMPASSLSKSKM
jgi:hypothetical protein